MKMLEDNYNEEKRRKKIIEESNLLDEMVKTRGWQEVIVPMLKDRMHHAWIDPRDEEFAKGDGKEAWLWAELNLFYARDAAKQLLEDVYARIEQGQAYFKEDKGEDLSVRMKI